MKSRDYSYFGWVLLLAAVILVLGLSLIAALDENGNGIQDSRENYTCPLFSECCYDGVCIEG